MVKKIIGWMAILLVICQVTLAQEKGEFSGDLQMTARIFERDSARNAFNTPFYDYLFYGTEAWLNLRYRIKGFDMGVRLDLYQNSYIFNPVREASKEGIGRWYVSKSIDKLHITGGHFYEQFGSGTIFRAYEARALGIDQSIFGLRLAYDITDDWRITALTGKLKNQFSLNEVKLYNPIIKGAHIDGYVKLKKKLKIRPGLAYMGRTLDLQTMEAIFLEVDSYTNQEDRFVPPFNTHLFSLYNTLYAGKFTWFTELSYKLPDVLRNAEGRLFNPNNGYVIYNSLSYSRKGFGLILQGKYTKNFDFRVSPNETLNAGIINFLPALTRINTFRLAARYNAATQFLGELAFQADMVYTPKRGLSFNANFSNLTNLENDLLFREIYLDVEHRPRKKKWSFTAGIQAVDYNQLVYENKGDYVHTLTPFGEFEYKFTRKKSLKTEISYMLTKRNYRLFGQEDPNPDKDQDLGDWFWIQSEFSMAPHWSFAISDMYRVSQNLHYPTFFIAYSKDASRFSLSYSKQPDGIICTGGVCRFEPAFSGVKFDVLTSF